MVEMNFFFNGLDIARNEYTDLTRLLEASLSKIKVPRIPRKLYLRSLPVETDQREGEIRGRER